MAPAGARRPLGFERRTPAVTGERRQPFDPGVLDALRATFSPLDAQALTQIRDALFERT